jgi:Tfp pilus assembly protein PilV
MIASVIFLVALAALLPLQVMGARMNRWSERTLEASALATDLAESMERWSYTASRLQPLLTVQAVDDPAVDPTWDMGTSDTPAARRSTGLADLGFERHDVQRPGPEYQPSG